MERSLSLLSRSLPVLFLLACSSIGAISAASKPPAPALPMDPIAVLLRLNCTEFVASITEVNLRSTFKQRRMTIFAPTNTAYSQLTDEGRERLMFNLNTLYYIVLNHAVVDKLVTANDLHDGDELRVGLSARASVNVRRTRKGREIWVRGKRIVTTNVATNRGIIHLVDGIMFPQSEMPPADFLGTYPQFTIVANMLRDASLTFPTAGYTFFAPSNDAFRRLPPFQYQALLNDNRTRLEMLYNMMIPKKIYTAPLVAYPGIFYTINRRILVMTNRKKEGVFLQQPSDRFGIIRKKIKVLLQDMELENGLIHSVDGVIFPPPMYNLLQSMRVFGMSLFADAISKEDLEDLFLGTSPLFTLFIPTNEAVKKLPSAIRRKMNSDNVYRRHVLLFHVYRGIHLMANIDSNLVLTSEFQDKAMIVKHNKGKSINIMQATVTHRDIAASNGVINVIDEVLLPQTTTVADTLRSQTLMRISIFSAALQTTELLTQLNSTRVIVFAPTDEAFNRLPAGSLPHIMSKPDLLRQILMYHIIPGFIYVEVLSSRWVYSFRTLLKSSRFRVHRRGNTPRDLHIMSSNGTSVVARGVSLDYPCSNGIINMIDHIVIPPGIDIMPPAKPDKLNEVTWAKEILADDKES